MQDNQVNTFTMMPFLIVNMIGVKKKISFKKILWMLGLWGCPHPAVYLISVCVGLPCARVVFAVL